MDSLYSRHYAPDVISAGTETVHWLFWQNWHSDIPQLVVNAFLEYAHAIKNSRFLLGNQSFGWNLAEAMKTPRVLEVCQFAPNCMPFVGENSYGYFHQVGLESYFVILYIKTFM